MASYRAIPATMTALKGILEARMIDDLNTTVTSPAVAILGSEELSKKPNKNELGIYLHRISVDPFGRNRYLQSNDTSKPPQPELAINLHILLIAWTDKGENEGALVGWGMQHIGSSLDLDISHLGVADSYWGETERLQVIPEEMSTENLLRIWDGLPRDYVLSTPYLIKTMRLHPVPEVSSGPLVQTIAKPMGVV